MIWLISEQKKEYAELISELISNGFPLFHYKKVSEAVSLLNSQSPEAILIDSDNTEISSLEFCYEIKISSQENRPCIFVVSSDESEKMEVSAFKAGADEFVTKPVRKSAFLKRLQARLSNSTPGRAILVKSNGSSVLKIDKESFSVYKNQLLIPL